MTRYSIVWSLAAAVLLAVLVSSCAEPALDGDAIMDATPPSVTRVLDKYVTVAITADLSGLREHERQMLPLLIEAIEPMNSAFWMEAYGDPGDILGGTEDPNTKLALEANFGPWDRLEGDAPFLPGVGEKPAGANFYPTDMTREEFEAAVEAAPDGGKALRSLYTMVRRDAAGELEAVPYHIVFAAEHALAAEKLRAAAALAEERRLSSQRSGLDGYEVGRARRRPGPDRDLRGSAVRLQGGARGLRSDQGSRVERTTRALRDDAARNAARHAGSGCVQEGNARIRR